jgi:hypothetical protein
MYLLDEEGIAQAGEVSSGMSAGAAKFERYAERTLRGGSSMVTACPFSAAWDVPTRPPDPPGPERLEAEAAPGASTARISDVGCSRG